ncbi:SRPBCC family protein [Arthrobacter sp. ISL-48]|uniref:SRPBCC family protein n=1 Tax=Arthrobacter sp. ISL-48 TaxID=2819110 RepID=UPI001BE93AF9|nr:SRPBCC family protein [Arthrobacter sp. ISL-48]MBT2532748.1 SRPBCC family protein [Arthrobacter sp. ISL-48]
MSTKVEKRILVNVPVSTAYNQWTQFEEFPHFMGGVKSVKQLSDDRLEWVAEIAGIRRKWTAKVLEQLPDRKVAWAATEGATNAGAVEFEDVGGGQTSLRLTLEYDPEGWVEKVGDKLHVVERQAEADLKKFKEFIEHEGYASGAWRGSVNEGTSVGTPGVEDAAASQGDSGKAGISGKAAGAAGVAAAAGAAAAMSAGTNKDADEARDVTGMDASMPMPPVTEPARMEPAPMDSSVPVEPMPMESVPMEPVSTDPTAAGTSDNPLAERGDEQIGHTFDQTNGMVDLEGESDETVEGENLSAGERREDDGRPGGLPPLGGNLGQH